MNTLAAWLVDGVAVAAVASLVTRIIPSNSPGQRHAVWWLTLLSLLALPWIPDALASPVTAAPDAWSSSVPGAQASMLTIPAPPSWLSFAALLGWGCIALRALARLAMNLHAVGRLAAKARSLPQERVARLQTFAAAQAGSRLVQVAVSSEIRGACAVGFLRPMVLLSSNLVATLDDEAIEAIVLHEYAHLQRYDDWTRLAQRVVVALAGMHPAVWWASRQIDVECEAACDRRVVARTGAPVAYARALTVAAEIAGRVNGLTPIAAPGSGRRAGLHARVVRLLTARPARPLVAWAASTVGAASLAASVLLTGGLPPLIAVTASETAMMALVSNPPPVSALQTLPDAAVTRLDGRDATADRWPGAERPRAPEAASANPATEAKHASAIVPPDIASVASGSGSTPEASPAASELPPTMALQPLATAAMPPGFSPLAPLLAGGDSRRPLDDDIAAAATRLGVATGDAAARAGTSIGRFFKNSSQAIATRF